MKTSDNKYTSNFLRLAHKSSSCHKEEMMDSALCGCFHCCRTFLPLQIEDWIAEGTRGETAVCPKCGIDSVLGSKFPVADEAFLRAMRAQWFGE